MKRKKVMSYVQGSIRSEFKKKLRELKELKSCPFIEDFDDVRNFAVEFKERRLVANSVRCLSMSFVKKHDVLKKCLKDLTRFVEKHGDREMRFYVERLPSTREYSSYSVERFPYILFLTETSCHAVQPWRMNRYLSLTDKWKDYCLSCLPPVASYAELGGLFRFGLL